MTIRNGPDGELRTRLWVALIATSDLHIKLIRALDAFDVWEKVPTKQSFQSMHESMCKLDEASEALVNCASWQDDDDSAEADDE